MVESRWLRWIGPGLVALGAIGFIASTTFGAGVRAWVPRACAGPPTDRIANARDPGPSSLAKMRGTPWFRLDGVLDGDGALDGQRLSIGLDGERTTHSLELASESFAAGPFGRVVLVGSDDGAVSHLQAIDVASGCAWVLADEHSVIRRATIDPSGTYVFETRVDRGSREDLGIWRRPVDGSTPARSVAPPLPADSRFGRTFSTEFTWDVGAGRLAVGSCGEVACRTRLIAPHDDGPAATMALPDLGPLIGLDGDRLVTYAACQGLPCPIVSIDLRTSARIELTEAAGAAVLVPTADGSRVVHEVGATAGRALRAVALDGGSVVDVGAVPAGLRLHPSAANAGTATRLPPGWVLLAPDGRLPLDGGTAKPVFRHVPDGSTVAFDEALR